VSAILYFLLKTLYVLITTCHIHPFGLLIGDKVWYQESIPPPEISDEAIILRKEIAVKMKGEIKEVEIGGHPTKAGEVVPPTGIVAPTGVVRETLQRIMIEAEIPWDRLSDLVGGVLGPLNCEGAEISLKIKIEASSEKGISKDTFESEVMKTLRKIGAKIIKEEAK